MKSSIRKMGNFQGVLIPKPILAQSGMEIGEVDITVEDDAIVIRKTKKQVRQGWDQASKLIANTANDALVWPEVGNDGDRNLVW